jgi:hypothetical protein
MSTYGEEEVEYIKQNKNAYSFNALFIYLTSNHWILNPVRYVGGNLIFELIATKSI